MNEQIIISIIIAMQLIACLFIVAVHIYQRRTRKLIRQMEFTNYQNNTKLMRHIWATSTLNQSIIPEGMILPPPGVDYRMAGDLLVFLTLLLEKNRPKLVVELGSGLSTIIMANQLQKWGGKLISIENNSYYAKRTADLLSGYSLASCTQVIYAPLEKYDSTHQWYCRKKIPNLDNIDLLVIDGPPGSICSNARYPALPFFWHALSDSATIILDDGVRPDEVNIASIWCGEYPDLKIEYTSMDHGPIIFNRTISEIH